MMPFDSDHDTSDRRDEILALASARNLKPVEQPSPATVPVPAPAASTASIIAQRIKVFLRYFWSKGK